MAVFFVKLRDRENELEFHGTLAKIYSYIRGIRQDDVEYSILEEDDGSSVEEDLESLANYCKLWG